MTSRWKIALASGAAACIAAVATMACSGDDAPRAGATVPPDSVPTDSVPGEGSDNGGVDRSITVSGHGTVEVTPDVADVFMGVQANEPTATEAMDTIGTKSQALVATLTAVGIEEKDIQTSGLSLYPMFRNDGQTIDGYQASTNVTVTVRDVSRVGEILDAVKGFVGEELTLGGISFSYADPEAVLGDARKAAIDNARVRAGQYAEAAGTEVGEIVRIVENGSTDVVPLARMEMATDAAAAPSVAIQPGSQELAADVTVVFAMS